MLLIVHDTLDNNSSVGSCFRFQFRKLHTFMYGLLYCLFSIEYQHIYAEQSLADARLYILTSTKQCVRDLAHGDYIHAVIWSIKTVSTRS